MHLERSIPIITLGIDHNKPRKVQVTLTRFYEKNARFPDTKAEATSERFQTSDPKRTAPGLASYFAFELNILLTCYKNIINILSLQH